ncbi:MAG: hypothetical protein LBQ12_11355 [Deltaproteobacteria bacterium]|nr:hypothetical protein [Deltaproteobacteria bacterium]
MNGKSFFEWGPEGSRERIPARWVRPQVGPGRFERRLQASPAADIPKATAWRLVILKGASAVEGALPLEADLQVSAGETYGPLRIFSSFDTSAGPDSRAVVKNPETANRGFRFSNPVRMSEAAAFVDVVPRHQGFKEQKDHWLQIARSRAARAGGADASGSAEPAEGPEGAGTAREASGAETAGAVPGPGTAGGASDGEPLEDDSVLSAVWLWGRLRPNTDYAVTFRRGMPDVFGQTLAEDRVIRFRTGPFKPAAVFATRGGVMEAAFPAVLPLKVRNMPAIPVFGRVMTDAETAGLIESWPYGLSEGTSSAPPPSVKAWVEGARRGAGPGAASLSLVPAYDSSKAQVTQPVSFSELFGGREKEGVIFAGAGAGEGSSYGLFQVTDLSLTVKFGAAGSLAWVTSLSDGKGVGGALVTALDCAGKTLWSSETGGDGLAALPAAKDLAAGVSPACARSRGLSSNIHFSARKGNERVFWSLAWQRGFWGYGGGVADRRDPLAGDWLDAFLVTSQPIYKPGETASFKIIARRFSQDSLTAPVPGRAKAFVADPDGTVAWEGAVDVNGYGAAALEFKIPEGSRYGDWKVILDLDPESGRKAEQMAYRRRERDFALAGTFRVGFFRAPAFDLEIGETKEAKAGDRVSFNVKGSYHYGAPLDAGEVDFELRSEPAWGWSPPGFGRDWSFTARTAMAKDSEGGWESDPAPPATEAEGSARLAGDGTAAFETVLPRTGPGAPRRYTITATARDLDSRSVSRSETFVAHPSDFCVGLRSRSFIGEQSKPFPFSVAAVGPDGAPRAGVEVSVKLYRREWTNARRLAPGGGFSYASEMTDVLVSERSVTTGTAPVGVELAPEKPGHHFALAEAEDPSGRTAAASRDFWVSGGEGGSWRLLDGDAVEMAADAREYKPGDVAKILVQSPFERGSGLMTVERGGVREARVFDLAGGAPVLEIPLTEADAPSVYVSVVISRGRSAPPPRDGSADLGKPMFRSGYLTLKVVSDRDRLKVDVSPSETELAPGAEAKVSVLVTDSEGAPFSDGEVALVAVDAGLIQIGGSEAFSPEALLWRDLPLSVKTVSSFGSVLDVRDWARKGGPGGAGGGGGFEAATDAEIRRDFKSVAYFEPHLKLGPDGRAEASFKLPDNLTAFRVFAVATGKGRASGTGEGRITVTRDLVLRASLPNHLTRGDEFAASAIVASRAAGEGVLTVEISPVAGMELLEAPVKSVPLKRGESVEVSFMARALPPALDAGPDTRREAPLSVGFEAVLGASRDSALFTVPVGDPGRLVTDATLTIAGAGSSMPEARLPEGADPGRGGLELAFSPGAEGLLDAPLAALAGYPYRCLEQTTSMAAGALFELRLYPEGSVPDGRRGNLRGQVENQIGLITSRSLAGGFSTWPGGDWNDRSPILTAWVLDFLTDAKADGFNVDASLASAAASYLSSEINTALRHDAGASGLEPGSRSPYGSPCRLCGAPSAQLYAMGAMFRAGGHSEGTFELFYRRRASLSLPERIFLLRAAAALPDSRARARQIAELVAMVASEIEISGAKAALKDLGGREAPQLWISGQDDLTAQALLALSEAAPRHELLPALVLGAASAGRGGNFGSTNRSVTVLRGVWNFLEARKGAGGGAGGEIDLAVKVILGGRSVLDGSLKGPRSPALKARASARELLNSPPPAWTVTGTGEAWIFQRLAWAPLLPDLSARATRGLVLSRSFQRVKPTPGPAGESRFRRGEVVKVTVTLMTSVARWNLVLEDPVPAGLEPVDFRLKDQNPNLAALLAEDPSARDPWTRWWSWHDHEEIRPDAIRLFAERLEPGVYTYSYLARPVTPGAYVLPGPFAEEMYNPENYGRGAGLKITVEK